MKACGEGDSTNTVSRLSCCIICFIVKLDTVSTKKVCFEIHIFSETQVHLNDFKKPIISILTSKFPCKVRPRIAEELKAYVFNLTSNRHKISKRCKGANDLVVLYSNIKTPNHLSPAPVTQNSSHQC